MYVMKAFNSAPTSMKVLGIVLAVILVYVVLAGLLKILPYLIVIGIIYLIANHYLGLRISAKGGIKIDQQ